MHNKILKKINIYNIKSYARNKFFNIICKFGLEKKIKEKIINYANIKNIIKNKESDGDIEIFFKDSYRIICPKKNIDVVMETCVNEDYTGKEHVIEKNDLIIDIGANIGSFSIYAAKKGAKVLAFEPDPYNVKYLAKNIEINQLSNNITIYNCAVSDKIGKIKFSINNNHACNSIIDNVDENTIEVKVTTLNQVIKDHNIKKIKLLKIDVEGAEYFILPNISAENYKKIDKIIGEYHIFRSRPELNYKKIKKLLSPFYSVIKNKIPYYFIAHR